MATFSNATISIATPNIANADISSNAEIAVSKLAQQVLQPEPLPLTSCRVWDAMHTMVVGTAAADDLAIITGTPGTDSPMLSAGDVKATSSARKVAFELAVPGNYEDGQTFQVRLRAAVETTIADGSCTIDLQAWKGDGAGAAGTDHVTTAAQSMNSLTPADYDFTIDATSIDPGDKLTCVVTITYVDTATATAVTPVIYSIDRLCDTRG